MTNTLALEVTNGPVLSVINKCLRNLRKSINKEQEEVLHLKPAIIAQIDELEKLRQPLASTILEEQISNSPYEDHNKKKEQPEVVIHEANHEAVVEDFLNLLYFGLLFDTHERGCCLTYDFVTNDATDLLGKSDLDLILKCIEHAKLWLQNSDQLVEPNTNIHASLRERLNKIIASDYFTTMLEMKGDVEVDAVATDYIILLHIWNNQNTSNGEPSLYFLLISLHVRVDSRYSF
ncbi:hypothetical protein UlMin_037200 [Ulmus minor]